jgi:hypothetical protein
LAALLIAGLVLLFWHRTPSELAEPHAARLAAKHGIIISFGHPNTFYTEPYGPADSAPSAEFSPRAAEGVQAAYALEGVEAALEQYPHGFVAKLIRAVFICGVLHVHGARSGGTYGPLWIVLAAPADFNAESIRLTSYMGVHHELSSFVLRYAPTTLSAWQALEPNNAAFTEDSRAAIARGLEHTAPDPATGFLSAYGATNPENDFNTYAETMFSDPAKLACLAKEHDLVRRKLSVVRAAYVEIDPAMDATFRQLGI